MCSEIESAYLIEEGSGDWIEVAQDMVQWWDFMKIVVKKIFEVVTAMNVKISVSWHMTLVTIYQTTWRHIPSNCYEELFSSLR
jgi:hypothetical protein